MRDKETDPEAPVASQHIEQTISMEKEQIASDAEIARTWSRDVIKVDERTKQKNPLAGLTKEELMADVETFAREKNLEHILDDLKKGALVAQSPKDFESFDELAEEEKEWLRREKTHRWSQPFMMYFMTSEVLPLMVRCSISLTPFYLVLCAGAAIVQGMDQTAVNGAQECVYPSILHLHLGI